METKSSERPTLATGGMANLKLRAGPEAPNSSACSSSAKGSFRKADGRLNLATRTSIVCYDVYLDGGCMRSDGRW